jgi:hypothetical protein
LRVADSEGLQSLVIASAGEERGVELIQEWAELTPLDLSPDGGEMVFLGREDFGDDPIL